jgi:hypothetical protein
MDKKKVNRVLSLNRFCFASEVQWLLLPPSDDDVAFCRWFLLEAKAALKSFFTCKTKIKLGKS